MTLCRWFSIPDPADLWQVISPKLRTRWMEYYRRNACHPLALQFTIATGSKTAYDIAARGKGQKYQPRDFIPHVPKQEVDATNPNAVLGAMGSL